MLLDQNCRRTGSTGSAWAGVNASPGCPCLLRFGFFRPTPAAFDAGSALLQVAIDNLALGFRNVLPRNSEAGSQGGEFPQQFNVKEKT